MEYLENPTQVLGQYFQQLKRDAEQIAEQTVREDEFDTRSVQIRTFINEQLATRPDISPEAQRELAECVRLIGDLATTDITWLKRNLQLLDSVDTSVRALLREPPQLEYARRTRKSVRYMVRPRFGSGLLESLKRSVKSSPLAVIILGLFLTFVLLTFVPLLSRGLDLSSVTIGEFLSINPSVLLMVGVVGALGSIVSIMVRIRDDFTAYTSNNDPWPWFFFGLFKPVIGALFALFVFATIRSGLLPLDTTDTTEGWLILAIAFVAGFSERFGRDILSSAESRLGGASPLASTNLSPNAVGEPVSQEQTQGTEKVNTAKQNGKPATVQTGRHLSAAEDGKVLVRRWFEEVFNARDLDVADEIVAADHISHDPTLPQLPPGPEGQKLLVELYYRAFPDAHITVESQIAEGNEVATRFIAHGTHQGELMGAAPTGNRVEITGTSVSRVAGGKIEETWTNYDSMSMLQQLGIIPPR